MSYLSFDETKSQGECVLHVAIRHSNRDVALLLYQYGARFKCCSSCKRFKPCSKTPKDDLEWLRDNVTTLGKKSGVSPNKGIVSTPLLSQVPVIREAEDDRPVSARDDSDLKTQRNLKRGLRVNSERNLPRTLENSSASSASSGSLNALVTPSPASRRSLLGSLFKRDK